MYSQRTFETQGHIITQTGHANSRFFQQLNMNFLQKWVRPGNILLNSTHFIIRKLYIRLSSVVVTGRRRQPAAESCEVGGWLGEYFRVNRNCDKCEFERPSGVIIFCNCNLSKMVFSYNYSLDIKLKFKSKSINFQHQQNSKKTLEIHSAKLSKKRNVYTCIRPIHPSENCFTVQLTAITK